MCGASAENTWTHEDTNTKRTPILSDQWKSAYGNASGNIDASGANGLQRTGINLLDQAVQARPYQQSAIMVNNDLWGMREELQNNGNRFSPFTTQATPTATASAGADYMGAYKNPWDNDVINASVNDYNTNVDRTANQMRAGRDASGAFGDRASIADAVYQGDASRGLGALVSGLRQTGFNTAAGLGQQDASRFTQNSQFNAQQETNNRAQQMQAIAEQGKSIAARAGISQQVLDNVFTNNQVNMDYATKAFQAGQITQEQLNTITRLSEQANGVDSQTNSDKNTFKANVDGDIF